MARDLITRLTVDSRSFVREMNRAEQTANRFGTRTTASVRRASGETEKANRRMGSSFASTAKRAAAAAGGIAIAYTAISKGKEAVSTTETLAKTTLGLSKNLGLTTKRASELAAVATVRNIAPQQLNMALKTLSTQLIQASDGTKKSADAFKQLGFSQTDIKRSQTDFNFLLDRTADGLAKLPPGANKVKIASQLMGRGWQTVFPILRDGSKAFEEQIALANKYGATFSGKTLKSTYDLIKAQRELKFAQLGLQISFTQNVAPTLLKAEKAFGRFAEQINKGDSDKAFSELFDNLSKTIQKATPVLAKNAGKLGIAIAKGVVTGFLQADPLSKAVILGLVAKRLGLFALAGRRAGAAFSAGMAETEGAGIAAGARRGGAASAAGGAAAGAAGGAGAGRLARAGGAARGLLGPAALAAAVITLTPEPIAGAAKRPIQEAPRQDAQRLVSKGDLEGLAKMRAEFVKVAQGQGKYRDEARKTVKAIDAIAASGRRLSTIKDFRQFGIAIGGSFNRQRAQGVLDGFKFLQSGAISSVKGMRTRISLDMKEIQKTFRNAPKSMRESMQGELNAAAVGVAKSMGKSKDAARQGWDEIKKIIRTDTGASRDAVLKGFPGIATAIGKAMDKGVLKSGAGMRQILSLIRRNTGGARTTVDKNFRAIADTIAEQVKKGRISTQQGMDAINSAVDKQLTAFGLPKTRRPATGGTGQSGQSGGRAQKARGGRVSRRDMGGWIGERGMAEGDNTPIWVGGGEAVVNRHQQPYVEQAMGFAKQMGVVPYGNLDELYQNETRPHYAFAQGGKVPASETSGRSSRSSTTWPSIRNIANKFGLTITSTYRTPSRNAAVGGVPGSWHTAGSPANPGAADFVPPSPAARAYAPSVGGKQILIHNAGSGLHLHVGFFPPGGRFGGANVSGGSGGVGGGASGASAGVGFSATPLKRIMVRGDLGKISTVAQRGVDKVREQADKFLEKKASEAGGAGGAVGTGATSNSMMGIARIILNVGKRFGADPKRMLAAMEAGLVESNLQNLSYGDLDSLGVFQQRSSWGSAAQRQNVTYAASKFFAAARGAGGATAGQLAQNVQVSAYPGRYNQRRGQAIGILRRLGYKASFAGFAKGGRVPGGRQLALSPGDLSALQWQERLARRSGAKVRDEHGPEDHARGGRVRRFAKGGWVRTLATLDPTQGQAPTYSAHGGMSFAELLVAGANRGRGRTLTSLLGMKAAYPNPTSKDKSYGMPMGQSIFIRKPGQKQSYRIWKNDVGSGQGSTAYTIDLHSKIANKLGWKPNGPVEVSRSGTADVGAAGKATAKADDSKPAVPTGLDLKQMRQPLVEGAFSVGYGVGQTGRRLGAPQLSDVYTALYPDEAGTTASGSPSTPTKPTRAPSKGIAAYTFPLPQFGSQGRTDRGQDMEASRPYATTVALGAGKVVGAGRGFPGMQLQLSEGPLASATVFYGHNTKVSKRVGQTVKAGAAMGATGGSPFAGTTHTEIGFIKLKGGKDSGYFSQSNSWSGPGSAGGQQMNRLLARMAPNRIKRRAMARGGFSGGRRSARPMRFQTGGFTPRSDPFGYSAPKPTTSKPLGVGKPAKSTKPGLLGGLLAAGNLDTYINKYLKATDEKLAATVLGKVGTALDALGDSFDKAVRQRLTRLQKAIDKIEQKDKFSAADLKLLGQYSNLQTTIGRIGPRPPVGGVDFAAKVGGIVTDPDSAAVGLKLAGKLDAYVKRFRGEKDEVKAKNLLSKIQQYLGELDTVSLAAIDGRYKRLTKEIVRLQKDGVTADEAKTIKTIQGLLTVYSEEAGRRIGLFVKDANEKLTAATDTEGSAIGRVLRRQGIDESSVAGLQALQYAGSNDPNAIRATITKLTAAQKEATRYGDTTTADDLKAQIADLTDKLDEAITVQIERGRQIMTQVATENLGKVTEFTDNIELQRRAKLISDKTAASETLSVREQALLGKFGPIAPKDRLEILAAIRDNTDATEANNDALNAVRDEIAKTNANAAAISSTSAAAAWKALADGLNGQIIGSGMVPRSRTGGSGRTTTY